MVVSILGAPERGKAFEVGLLGASTLPDAPVRRDCAPNNPWHIWRAVASHSLSPRTPLRRGFAEASSPRIHAHRGFTLPEDSSSPTTHLPSNLTLPENSPSPRSDPHPRLSPNTHTHTHTLGMHPRRGGVKTRGLRNHPVRNVDFARPCLLFPMDNFPSFRVRVSMPFGRTHMF